MSTVAAAAAPRRSLVPGALAGPAWWPVAIAATVVTALATTRSLQLGASFAIVVLAVAVHARSRSAGYVAMWLTWLLLPCLRRMLLVETGLSESDPLAAVPFVVTAVIAAVELWRGPLSRRAMWIMGAAAAGYLLGVPTGLSAPSSMAFAFVAYLTGVLAFGLGYRETLSRPTLPRVLLASMPVLSIYGIFQYFAPLPLWDKRWLGVTAFITAHAPEDGKIRVWSTLNAPATFAWLLALTIIVYLVAGRFPLSRVVGLGLVLTALSLTYVRGAWVGLAAALVVLLVVSPMRATPRIALVIGVIALGVPVLAAGTGTGSAITARFNTLFNLGQDTSAQQRLATPKTIIPAAIDAPLGHGLGIAGEATRLNRGQGLRAADNGLLALVLQLGVAGMLLVLGAAAAGVRIAWLNVRHSARRADVLIFTALAFLSVVMLVGDVLFAITGVIAWYLIGMAVARYEARTEVRTG